MSGSCDVWVNHVWTVPAERMKMKKEHRVPLSTRVVAIVKELAATRLNEFVFPGIKRGKPLSDGAMLAMLHDLRPDITVHGFRSAFKDWASDETNFPDHLSEAALAHASGDKVRGAYARSDLFQKRRELMDAWAEYWPPVAAKRRRPPGQARQENRRASATAA